MKDNTNAIETMLYLQKGDPTAPNRNAYLYTWHDDKVDAGTASQYDEDSDEQAIATIDQCIKFFGHAATRELEEHMEILQEEFLAHLEQLLQDNNINIQEKLILSLSADNQLILQCQEQEDALLLALGSDKKLLNNLQLLRKAALVSRGLDYILAVQNNNDDNNMPQYRVCTKGALSHFYLKG